MKCGEKPLFKGSGSWCSANDPITHECKHNGLISGKPCPYYLPYEGKPSTESHKTPAHITNAIESLEV